MATLAGHLEPVPWSVQSAGQRFVTAVDRAAPLPRTRSDIQSVLDK